MDLFGIKKKKQDLLNKEASLSALLSEAQSLSQSLEEKASQLAEKESQLKRLEDNLATHQAKIESEWGHIVSETSTIVQSRTLSTIRQVLRKPYLEQTLVFEDLYNTRDAELLDNPKIQAAFTEDMQLHYPLSAEVKITGQSGTTYTVSLNSCTCPDFQHHKQPCKHMYKLAIELGLLLRFSDMRLNKVRAVSDKAIADQAELAKQAQAFEQHKSEALKGTPFLISLWTDYEAYLDSQRIRKLEANRAKKSADIVRQIKEEKQKLLAENKTLWHQLRFLEAQFPWIEDYKENALKPPAVIAALNDGLFPDEYTFLSQWITHDEFLTSPEAQKYQRALDNYCRRERTEWSLGLDYERFIGYEYENKGWRVNYVGATEKKEDMGRDLIVRQGKNVKIIQCKRFSKAKNHIVRENVVFQLYGSAALYGLQHPKAKVSAAIYTTSVLSDEARSCAKEMGIEIHEDFQLETYPLIKCNIGNDGVRRFHLPFSQMYDRLHITPSKGDCYVYTVQEAMDKGFVKTKNWIGK